MTTKPVVFDPVVPPKMKRRKIRKAEALWVLAQGEPMPDDEVLTKWGERRQGMTGEVRGRMLQVIYIDQPRQILIISVHWKITKAEQRRREERGEL